MKTLIDTPFSTDVFLGFHEPSAGNFADNMEFHQFSDGEQNTDSHQCISYSITTWDWKYTNCEDNLQMLCEGMHLFFYPEKQNDNVIIGMILSPPFLLGP